VTYRRLAFLAISLALPALSQDIHLLTDNNSESIGQVKNVRQLSATTHRVLALDAHGALHEWRRATRTWQIVPNTPQGITKIAAGPNHTLLLTTDGAVWTAGQNTMGQLGDGTITTRATFQKLEKLPEITDIDAGPDYSLAIDTSGRTWAWGANWTNLVPTATAKAILTPQPTLQSKQQPRTATAVLANRETVTLSAPNVHVPPSASSGTLTVTANEAWTATSSNSWLTFTTNNQTITYSYSANPSTLPRQATIFVNGRPFTVNQLGATGRYNPWAPNEAGTLTAIASSENPLPPRPGENNRIYDARLNNPGAVIVDRNGDVLIADGNRIRKITVGSDIISPFAGTGAAGYAGDNGLAADAQLRDAAALAINAAGDIYIADSGNHAIRRISAGIITTVAGTGVQGFSGDNGPATSAQLNTPLGVAVDASGNIYVADSFNNRIRKIDVNSGQITTVAGSGVQGFSGDNGPGTAAQLFAPFGVAVDLSGNLYIADYLNARIRKINNGIITTLAGTGVQGFSGDNGPATSAQLQYPAGVAVDAGGIIYFADSNNHRIRKIANGLITTIAGSGTQGGPSLRFGYVYNGPATATQLSFPRGVAVDGLGNVFIADTTNNRIAFLDTTSPLITLSPATAAVSEAAGSGTINVTANGLWVATGNANWLTLATPSGNGNTTLNYTYTANTTYLTRTATVTVNDKQFTITQSGSPAPLNTAIAAPSAGSRTFTVNVQPTDNWTAASSAPWLTVSPASGTGSQTLTLTFTANAGDTGRIATVTAAGQSFVIAQAAANGAYSPWGALGNSIIRTIAGTGSASFSGDNGPASSAQLFNPQGLTVDGSGNIYFADTRNNRVRRIDATTGIITTIAGTGAPSFSGDNGPAFAAALNNPLAVAIDPAGNLFIADYTNNRIRKVAAGTNLISTVAQPSAPTGLALDDAGNLYIASANQILKLDALTSVLSIIAGTGPQGFSGDGGPATAATLRAAYGVAVDFNRNVYIADKDNNRIRKIETGTGIITTVAANLAAPAGLATDAMGNVYIAEYGGHRIHKLTVADGLVTTVAGTGSPAYSGDNGPATAARLNYPVGVAVDGIGNLYIGDNLNNRIRFVDLTTPALTLSPVWTNLPATATSGLLDIRTTPTSSLWLASTNVNWLSLPQSSGTGMLTYDATANTAVTNRSAIITVSTVPALVVQSGVAASLAPASATLAPAATSGTIALTVTPAVSWTATSSAPWLTVTPASGTGNQSLTFSATANTATIGRTATLLIAGQPFTVNQSALNGAATSWGAIGNGIIRTIAGTGLPGVTGDGGPATAARLASPQGLEFDANGNIFFADTTNNRIRRIDAATGLISAVATGLNNPLDVAIDSQGNVLFTDYSNNRVLRISAANGAVSPLLTGIPGPIGIAVDPSDNIFIVETAGAVRRIDAATGVSFRIAGTGAPGFSGDNGPAHLAQFRSPYGIAINAAGDLFIADKDNHRIRKITGTGIVTTIAGTGAPGFSGDGGPATAAQLNTPANLAVDPAGNLYFSDYGSNRVRKIDAATGIISTVAGGGASFGIDVPGTAVRLFQPAGLAVDRAGSLAIGDSGNYRVRFLDFTTPVIPPTPPILASASPATSNTATQTFTITARDFNGAADISSFYFLIAPSPNITVNSCHGYYSRPAGSYFLYNDALTSTGSTPDGTLQNSQCALLAGSSSTSFLGNDLTLNLTLRRQGIYTAGALKLYIWVTDAANTGTGWVQVTDWQLFTNQPPTLVSAAPATATPPTQTFQFVARDPNGAIDLARIYFLVNSDSAIPANTCHGYYERAINAVFLYNDATNALLAPVGLGQTGTVQNSQCAINAATSSASASGNELQLNLDITRKGTYANGSRNLYAWVTDYTNAGTGWILVSSWNIGGQQPPTLLSATPANPATATETLAITVRDGNGSADISRIYFLLDTAPAVPQNSCHGFYDRSTNAVYLYNDALTTLSATPGTIQNSQCAITGFSVSTDSTNLQLRLDVTRKGSYATGTKNLYIWATDSANNNTGWLPALTWTLGVPQAPVLVAATPSASTTASQAFTISARNTDRVYFLVNTSTAIPAYSCHGFYDRPANTVYLYNDALTAFNTTNSQCAISGVSVTSNAVDLNLTMTITRQGAYASGTQNVYFWLTGAAGTGSGTGWQQATTWTLGGATVPSLISTSPTNSTAANQTFTITARNTTRIYFLVNTNTSIPANTCHGFYDRTTNTVSLYNDALTGFTPPNNQCAVANFNAQTSGSDLILTLTLTRQGSYLTGNKNLYLWLVDNNNGTGWLPAATWPF
jgi:sugar lactone lactonase YvrE